MFKITTTAQVERTYEVQADNEAQARTRIRQYISDPTSLAEGVISAPEAKDVTPERIKTAVKPKAPKKTAAKPAAATPEPPADETEEQTDEPTEPGDDGETPTEPELDF